MTEIFSGFKFDFILSRKIPYTELSEDIPNVIFVTENNSLIGFNITLQKSTTLEDAEKICTDFAYVLSDLISIKSYRYVTPHLGGFEAGRATGKKG
jgi:hypothetical protein